jgi:conjugative transfer signal peptidase TraF
MTRFYALATIGAAGFFTGAFGALAWKPAVPRLIWNASASVPAGLYSITRETPPRVGDLVAIRPPAPVSAFLAKRGYLPAGLPLLKHVAALPGARVCRSGVFVTVDGAGAARALRYDRVGRPLPKWDGCRIVGRGELFLLNASPQSLDSRYFGPFPAAGVSGIAHPIVTRSAPRAPLRWHGGTPTARRP